MENKIKGPDVNETVNNFMFKTKIKNNDGEFSSQEIPYDMRQ